MGAVERSRPSPASWRTPRKLTSSLQAPSSGHWKPALQVPRVHLLGYVLGPREHGGKANHVLVTANPKQKPGQCETAQRQLTLSPLGTSRQKVKARNRTRNRSQQPLFCSGTLRPQTCSHVPCSLLFQKFSQTNKLQTFFIGLSLK